MDMNPLKIHQADSSVSTSRSVTILGSTGSVGCNTVELIEKNLEQFTIEALTANRNIQLLADQARRLKPKTAVLADPEGYQELKDALAGTGIHVAAGADAIIEAADQPADWVMASIVGAAGLKPTLTAVRRGATIGLANKECLVSAGDVFVRELHQDPRRRQPPHRLPLRADAHPGASAKTGLGVDINFTEHFTPAVCFPDGVAVTPIRLPRLAELGVCRGCREQGHHRDEAEEFMGHVCLP